MLKLVGIAINHFFFLVLVERAREIILSLPGVFSLTTGPRLCSLSAEVVSVRKTWQKAKIDPSSSTLVPDSSGPYTINLAFILRTMFLNKKIFP